MQRSKQQALMFLLGAVLVGGVLGFSADRVMSKKPPRESNRMRFYNDIGIAPEQRVKMDSVLDETNCKTSELMKSIKPAMDSVKAGSAKALLGLMTDQQRTAYFARETRFKAQWDSIEKARTARTASDHADRPRRCGSAGPGAGGPGPNHGPGGPFF